MHVFIYQFKLLLRDRTMVFWTFLFPCILATFFYLALSTLTDAEQFTPAQLAVVEVKEDRYLQNMLEELSKDQPDQLLDIHYTSLSQAKKLLNDDQIDGYLVVDQELKTVYQDNGISQTIIQTVIDTYLQTQHTLSTIAQFDQDAFSKLLQNNINQQYQYFQSTKMSSLDVSVIYFYTLIGMTCMYGGFWGLQVTYYSEANLSHQGTRCHIAPLKKWKVVLSGIMAAFFIQVSAAFVLLAYLIYGLDVSFGHELGYVLLCMLIGIYVGITFGIVIGTAFHCSQNKKISILSMSSLFLSFLSGMMVIDMKYLIQEYMPFLATINPVQLITDSLYALYYYPTLDRYYQNLFMLIGMGIVLTCLSMLMLRRKQYDSL